MIPATLPSPAPAPTPGADPGRARTAPEDRFEQVLDHATRGGGAPHDRTTERQGRSTGERRTAGARDEEPGADGHEQALAAMPADVPGRVVLTGTAHDAQGEAGPDPEVSLDAATGLHAATVDGDATEVDPSATGDLERPVVALEAAEVPETAAHPVDAEATAPEYGSTVTGADEEGTDGSIEQTAGARPADGTVDDEGSASRPAANGAHRVNTDASAHADGDATDDGGGGTALRGADPSTGRAVDAPRPQAPADRTAPPSTPAPDVAAHLDAATPPAPGAPIATAPTATAAPAAPAVPPPLAQQLMGHVTPLLVGPDGTHELTIELRPVELGTVRLEVVLDDGVLSVRLHADDPASRRLLAQSLGDLRSALTDAGIDAGSLDVGDPRSGASADGRDGRSDGTPRPPRDATAATPARPSRAVTPSSAAVDVLL